MSARLEIDPTGRNPMGRAEGSLRVRNLEVSEKQGERKSRFSGKVAKSTVSLGWWTIEILRTRDLPRFSSPLAVSLSPSGGAFPMGNVTFRRCKSRAAKNRVLSRQNGRDSPFHGWSGSGGDRPGGRRLIWDQSDTFCLHDQHADRPRYIGDRIPTRQSPRALADPSRGIIRRRSARAPGRASLAIPPVAALVTPADPSCRRWPSRRACSGRRRTHRTLTHHRARHGHIPYSNARAAECLPSNTPKPE
jgi:hypothetical protein